MIIDEKGKLFGRINIIDFFIGLAVIGFCIMGFKAYMLLSHPPKANIIPSAITQEEINKKKTEDYITGLHKDIEKMKAEIEYENTKKEYNKVRKTVK